MIEIRIRKALAEFELEVEQLIDSVPLAIFGPSGSGKSTILRSVAGLISPDSGRIAINGQVLFDSESGIDLPAAERGVGFVPQDGLLFPHLSVKRNLLYGYQRIKNRSRTIALDDVVEVLEIGSLLDRQPLTLSGGERQRVALGRALLTSPNLLLFDEPLASVDSRLKDRILPYLKRAVDHFAIPAIYVSHDHGEVTHMAENIMVLNRGRVLACGNYLEIIDHPAVYRTFSREGINNVFTAVVLADNPNEGFTSVESGGTEFKVPPLQAEPGVSVTLNVKANDIILAKEKPSRISTRNVIEGSVKRVAKVEELLLVHIDAGCELVVELTPSAVRELQLEAGASVWVLIKTNSFSVGNLVR